MTVRELREILDKLPDGMEIELNIGEYSFIELSSDIMAIYDEALIFNLKLWAFSTPVEDYLLQS